jgi:CubicO group peptidase (beta-lactamase class C family)
MWSKAIDGVTCYATKGLRSFPRGSDTAPDRRAGGIGHTLYDVTGSEPRSSPELMIAIRALGDKALALEGIHVHISGQSPVEYHWVDDIRRDIFSASKTFTSVAIGIAQDEGLLNVDDSILSHVGHLTSAPARGVEEITIRHLLTMTSGITYRWDDPDADHPGEAAVDILTTPLGTTPGTAFDYRGANTYLLSRIIHACSGQDLRDFLLPRLFTPLAIRNPQWLRCPLGYSLGALGLHLRTAEMARLGRTLLDGGRFLDQQLVPATFVASMTADCVPTNGHTAAGATAPHPDNALYGRHVWMCYRDDAWRMDGLYGQFSVVLPRQQACVTTTAHYRGATTDILDAIWSDIVPALN